MTTAPGRRISHVPQGWYAGRGAYVHPTAQIGVGTRLGPNVYIGPGVVVGADCRVQAGAVIGEDGFGYEQTVVWDGLSRETRWKPKPHEFGVVIGDDVHIGANACIDRGSWRDTTIATGVRIDNGVHVAHNCLIRRNAVVVAQAMLAGSVEVGEEAWIGPSACVMQRLLVGHRALVGMGAVVIRDVQTNTTVAGNPARKIADVGVRDSM
jgi:UDP-3-O-[3-hydroxymyristoyl] glucosamine N-acyltransferase